MTVRRLESHLHIVASRHYLKSWRTLGAHTTCDRLASLLTPLDGAKDVTTHLQKDIIVSPKKERDRVTS